MSKNKHAEPDDDGGDGDGCLSNVFRLQFRRWRCISVASFWAGHVKVRSAAFVRYADDWWRSYQSAYLLLAQHCRHHFISCLYRPSLGPLRHCFFTCLSVCVCVHTCIRSCHQRRFSTSLPLTFSLLLPMTFLLPLLVSFEDDSDLPRKFCFTPWFSSLPQDCRGW